MPEEPEPKEEPKGNLPDEVTKVLEDIKAKLENQTVKEPAAVPASAPSYADQRDGLKKSLGYSEEQMQAHERMIQSQQAPIQETLGWTKLEKKQDIDSFRKEIESELAPYPPERRTPDIMEKIYFYVKGKHADSKPVVPSPKTTPQTPRVEGTRVSQGPGYSGNDPGLSGSREESQEETPLSDQEKFVASKMGVSEKDYSVSKKVGKSIRELRPIDTRQPQGLADFELRKLQGIR